MWEKTRLYYFFMLSPFLREKFNGSGGGHTKKLPYNEPIIDKSMKCCYTIQEGPFFVWVWKCGPCLFNFQRTLVVVEKGALLSSTKKKVLRSGCTKVLLSIMQWTTARLPSKSFVCFLKAASFPQLQQLESLFFKLNAAEKDVDMTRHWQNAVPHVALRLAMINSANYASILCMYSICFSGNWRAVLCVYHWMRKKCCFFRMCFVCPSLPMLIYILTVIFTRIYNYTVLSYPRKMFAAYFQPSWT